MSLPLPVLLLLSLLSWCLTADAQDRVSVGLPPPRWRRGEMDIYQISTGLGNAGFFILPDGTTLLVDAGAINRDYHRNYHPVERPDTTRSAGEWIARFIRQVWPGTGPPVIDYALLTHFHDDHMGYPDKASPLAPAIGGLAPAPYHLSGITEVGTLLCIRTMLDRGWPQYDFPAPLNDPMIVNYRDFLEAQHRTNGLAAAQFTPGRKDQIRLLHHPRRYAAAFEIRNIIANGRLWTGEGEHTRNLFPEKDSAKNPYLYENNSSCGIRITYGRFRYFSGGDLVGRPAGATPAWADFESALAPVVGKVDVLVADHHGGRDAVNDSLLRVLQPQVVILPVWAPSYTDTSLLRRVAQAAPGPARSAGPSRRIPGWAQAVSTVDGHILVRVAADGRSFIVMQLTDSDETLRVTAIYGPYRTGS